MLATFQWYAYNDVNSHLLFGITKAQLADHLWAVSDKSIELNMQLFTPEKRSRRKSSGERAEYWFGPYKRSCMYADVELLLRYMARGYAEPFEAPAEEAQGFGRQCMRMCRGLMSRAEPLHNRCGLECFALVKSSALLTNEEMLADYEQHRADAMRTQAPRYHALLARLPWALQFKFPADFVTDWVRVTDDAAEEDLAADDAADQERAAGDGAGGEEVDS